LGSRRPEGVLLDFSSITDPAVLFESLILYRQTHDRLYVSEQSVNVYVESDPLDWHGGRFDLRDPDFIGHIKRAIASDDISLESWNLSLALKIFQHSLKEGYIEILPNPPKDPELDEFLESKGLDRVRGRYLEFGGRVEESVQIGPLSGGREATLSDIRLAIGKGFQISVGSMTRTEVPLADLATAGLLAQVKDGELKQGIRLSNPSSLDDLYWAIARPCMLQQIVQATQSVIAERKVKEDLLFFFPRLLADKVTFGLWNAAEILYRVYRHYLQRRSRTVNP